MVKFLYPVALTMSLAICTSVSAGSFVIGIFNTNTLPQVNFSLPAPLNDTVFHQLSFEEVKALPFPNHVRIIWKVSGEANGKLFSVERSSNGISFEFIGSVNATGLSSYSFLDYNPLKGNNFYRIAYLDKDGKKSYSTIFETDFNTRNGLKAVAGYGKITAILEIKDVGSYQLALVNSYGQPVYQGELKYDGTINTFEIPVQNSLPPGIYSIMVRGSNGINISCQILLK